MNSSPAEAEGIAVYITDLDGPGSPLLRAIFTTGDDWTSLPDEDAQP